MRRLLLGLLLWTGQVAVSADDVSVRMDGERLIAEIRSDSAGTLCGTAELLDLTDAMRWRGEARETLSTPGTFTIPLDVRVQGLSPEQQTELTWHRLRYTAGPCGTEPKPVIVSMSEVFRDAFDIRVRAPEWTWGTSYRFQVQAMTPTGVALSGVELEAELGGVRREGKTGTDGAAFVEIPLAEGEVDAGSLRVTARHNGLVRVVELDTHAGWSLSALISTDKAIYQPGQTLHVRALLLDASRRPIVARDATVHIRKERGGSVFRGDGVTSAFGVAAADWLIPADAEAGTYRVSVTRRDSGDPDPWSVVEVEVSRYELPTFTVEVKPSRPYALPGESQEVAVTATYLSGQPLPRFSARIVKPLGWGWREKEEPEVVAAGEAGGDGTFRATITLPSLEKTRWRRFEDTEFAAYVTDPTTGKTERRRFSLRATAEPIHVYLVAGRNRHSALASTLYVSTFSADGAPVECVVLVSVDGKAVGELKTNRYGAGKLVAVLPAGKTLALEATDAKGRRGRSEDESWNWRWDRSEDLPEARLVTSKTIHRNGEPISLEVETSFAEGRLAVDLAREYDLLACLSVEIRNHRGHLTIPFRPEFRGAITLAAYPDAGQWETRLYHSAAYATILYPDDRELRLSAKTSKRSYRPGERASARFAVASTDGRPVVGALGVAVVDRAVEERVRGEGSRRWYREGSDPFTEPFRTLLDSEDEFGGLTLADLRRLDTKKPVPPGLDLVAELLLNQWPRYSPMVTTSAKAPHFETLLDRSLGPIRSALRAGNSPLPRDRGELDARLAALGVVHPVDPWDEPYRFEFGEEGAVDVVRIVSAGPDKRHGTPDDVVGAAFHVSHYVKEEAALQRAVEGYHARTSRYLIDAPTLIAEVRSRGEDPASWRDRKGNPVSIEVRRAGDKVAAEMRSEKGALLASAWIDFSRELVVSISEALREYTRRMDCPPENANEFGQALAEAGLPVPVRDPFGIPWFARFRVRNGPADAMIVERGGRRYLRKLAGSEISVELFSAGADGVEGTADDQWEWQLALARPSYEVLQEIDTPPVAPESAAPRTDTRAASIRGVVTDENGSPLPGVEVSCRDALQLEKRTVVTDVRGVYRFSDLPDDTYSLEFRLSGFTTVTRTGVVVREGRAVADVDVRLNVASVAAEATVAAESPMVGTAQTSAASAETRDKRNRLLPPLPRTPRLRTFFPETLVWEPGLVTGKDGKARIRFQLADNVTTWTLFAVASSADGRVGTARTEFGAFQAFFLDHDPPRVLTVGDEIRLPVVVRNYQSHEQAVELSFSPAPGIRLLGEAKRETTVGVRDSTTETLALRAESAVTASMLRVTARGLGEPRQAQPTDAIEKPVDVRRNAEERSVARGTIVRGNTSLDVEVPANALPGSVRANLTVYPTVLAQVSEAVEAVLQRPWGCAEQTISSAYPSVLLLESLKRAAVARPPLEERARRYLRVALEKLRSFQGPSGGLTYFGSGSEDSALTAYELGFLLDARPFVEIDESTLSGAAGALLKSQLQDGSWSEPGSGSRKLATTAFAATALARTGSPTNLSAARRALSYLETFVAASSALGKEEEAYTLAAFVLLTDAAGETARGDAAVARLRALGKPAAGGGVFWNAGSTSPFWSWGRAGDVEATALAARALLGRPGSRALADKALFYLLGAKDQFGIWFSGHATKEALGALLAGSGEAVPVAAEVVVRVGDKIVRRIPLVAGSSDAIPVDLSSEVHGGQNAIAVEAPEEVRAIVHIVVRSDVPWRAPTTSPDLAFDVGFDRTRARAGQEIVANVVARRTSALGGGMLLAEVGIPPGAEVDRAALQDIVRDYRRGIWQYDVQPDRVVFYVWSLWTTGTEARFSFRFRPRYPIKALTAPSSLVDYYNPDARVTLPPTRFIVE
jgi:hypothetical protein